MKRCIILGLFGLILFQRPVLADMIETKDQGILNGKVLSQNDQEIRFKDAKGKEHRFVKTDVLYLDTGSVSAPAEDTPFAEKVKTKAAQLWAVAQKAPEALKKSTDKLTDKFIGEAGKPLDRSAANAKSDALAKSMDEASQAAVAMSKKNMLITSEIKRQTKEGYSDSKSSDEHKGRFSSL